MDGQRKHLAFIGSLDGRDLRQRSFAKRRSKLNAIDRHFVRRSRLSACEVPFPGFSLACHVYLEHMPQLFNDFGLVWRIRCAPHSLTCYRNCVAQPEFGRIHGVIIFLWILRHHSRLRHKLT